MSSDDITFDFLRQRAALDLSPEQQAEFQRLVKVLRFGSKFQMIFVEIGDVGLRDQLIARLTEILQPGHLQCSLIDLGNAGYDKMAGFEERLHENNKAQVDVIHIVNTEQWLNDERLHGLNLRREMLAHTLECKLVFWMSPAMLDKVAQYAADLWSWRSGVYSFQTVVSPSLPPPQVASRLSGTSSFAERSQRIWALRQALSNVTDDDLRGPLLDELATLLFRMGAYDDALRIRVNEELPAYQRQGMQRAEAITYNEIADLLSNQGHFEDALEIRMNKALPILRELGELRLEAEVQLDIAFTLRAQGKLQEAFHICKDIVMPLAHKLQDETLETQANVRIAEIYFDQQRYNEALDIQLNNVLPIWLKNNNELSTAIAYGNIANIFEYIGRYDEALIWRTTKELPIHLQRNDAEAVAICKAEIASILTRQEKLDEAQKLLEDEVLPVLRQLDDSRSIAVTHERLASILAMQGKFEEALQVQQNQCLPVFQQLKDIPSIARTATVIARLHKYLGNKAAAIDSLNEAKKAYSCLEEPLASRGIEKVNLMIAEIPSTTD